MEIKLTDLKLCDVVILNDVETKTNVTIKIDSLNMNLKNDSYSEKANVSGYKINDYDGGIETNMIYHAMVNSINKDDKGSIKIECNAWVVLLKN